MSDVNEPQDVANFRRVMGKSADALTDSVLRQFLVANEWNMAHAQKQLQETLDWRAANDIDHIPVATTTNQLPLLVAVRGYKHIQDGNLVAAPGLSESVFRIGKFIGGDCFHKFDKDGHPVLIDRTGFHDTKHLGNNVTSEEIANFQVACNEFLNRVIMPEASERAGYPVHSETIIFDCKNLSLWQFHMNALFHLKAILDIVQHYYPETLHRLLIVNVPSAFLAMWKIVKPWLNDRTLEKVHIVGKDESRNVLLKYIHMEDLPDFLGGTCVCAHMFGGCVPSPSLTTSKPNEQSNESVASAYSTEIMARAKNDNSLCKLA